MITAFAAITHVIRKRESPLEPFKRTAQLAEAEQEKAFVNLDNAVQELMKAVEEKSK